MELRSRRLDGPARGIIMTMLGAVLFSLMPLWVRSVQPPFAPAMVFYRALIGSATMAVLVLGLPAYRAQLRELLRRPRLLALLAGMGACMGTSTLFYFLALTHTTVAKALLVSYTSPIYVAILGPLVLKEPSHRLTWVAVALGLTGIACITEPQHLLTVQSSEAIGILAGLLSGLGFGGVFLFGRYLAPHVSSLVRVMAGGAVVSLLMLPWMFQTDLSFLTHNFLWLALLGIVCMAIPFALFFQGQSYIPAQASSLISLLEPVCGIFIGYLAFGETLSPLAGLGAALILISTYLAGRTAGGP
jgi:drug/metabolite transporter (DMT)-like permease